MIDDDDDDDYVVERGQRTKSCYENTILNNKTHKEGVTSNTDGRR